MHPIPDAILVLQLFQQDQSCIIAFFDAVDSLTFSVCVFVYGNTGVFYYAQCIAVVILVPHGMIHFIKILCCFLSPVGIRGIGYIHASRLISKEAAVKLKLAGIQIRIGQIMQSMGINAACGAGIAGGVFLYSGIIGGMSKQIVAGIGKVASSQSTLILRQREHHQCMCSELILILEEGSFRL